MVRALSGHDFRRRHEGIVNKTTENEMQCRNCEEDQETASHVIMDCPVFTTLRAQAFGSYSADVSQVWTVHTLSRFLSAYPIAEMESDTTREIPP